MIGKNQSPDIGKNTQFPNNPIGTKPKGAKHLSTHIKEMLEDENFHLKLENGELVKDKPIKAIIKAAIIKAAQGDMKAFDMLGKYGWGNKVIHDFEPGLFTKAKLEIELVDVPKVEPETEEGT